MRSWESVARPGEQAGHDPCRRRLLGRGQARVHSVRGWRRAVMQRAARPRVGSGRPDGYVVRCRPRVRSAVHHCGDSLAREHW
jgi:hypothetical protein